MLAETPAELTTVLSPMQGRWYFDLARDHQPDLILPHRQTPDLSGDAP